MSITWFVSDNEGLYNIKRETPSFDVKTPMYNADSLKMLFENIKLSYTLNWENHIVQETYLKAISTEERGTIHIQV